MEQIKTYIQNIKSEDIKEIVIAIIVIAVFWITSSWFSRIVMKIFKIKEEDRKNLKKNNIYKGLKYIFMSIGFLIAIVILKLPPTAENILIKILRIIIVINIAQILVGMLSFNSKIMEKVSQNEKFAKNKSTIKLINKAIKIVIYVVAGYIIITDLGYDLSGLIAGLGLGSVVIALAAQELVSNMLSGMAIASEEPFKVGDYVTIGNTSGTIEEIRFRSVKVKTADNAIVTIQNTKILNEYVINSSSIDSRRFDFSLRLPLDTTANKATELMESIYIILANNEGVKDDSTQIYIDAINEDSIMLKGYTYLNILGYNDFLKFKTEFNLQIMKLLENKNMKLACPSYDINVNGDGDFDNFYNKKS